MGRNFKQSKIKFSIITPVYNSEFFLTELCSRIKKVMAKIGSHFEVIMVEDGSSDGSRKIIKQIHQRDKRFKGVILERNFSQHNAIICGFHFAQGDYVITIDSDLQNPPEEIPKLIKKITHSDCDLVYGRYNKKKHNWFRNIGSEIHYLFPAITYGRRIKITAMRIIKKNVIEKIIKSTNPGVNIDALILRLYPEIKINKAVVKHDVRKAGKSSYTFIKLVKYSLKYFSCYYFPYKKTAPQFKIRYKWLS